MSEEAPTSSLPPLKPKSSKEKKTKNPKSKSKIEKNSQNEELTASQIKQEITKLYPKLQQIEKDIQNLQTQIPSNLSKTILTLSQDIQRIRSQIYPSNSSDSGREDIPSKLADLESQLLLQLEVSIQASSSTLEKKLLESSQEGKEFGSTPSEISTPTSSNNKNNINSRVKAIENLITKQQDRNQHRLSNIEKNLAKLALGPSQNDENNTLKQLSSEVDSHRVKITELKNRINNIQEELSHPSQTPMISLEVPDFDFDQMISSSGKATANSNKIEISDPLDDEIFRVQKEISDFQNQYLHALQDLQEKADLCDNRMRNINKTAIDLVTTTTSIQSRIIEAENLSSSLMSQVQEIARKLNGDQSQEEIEKLARQLRTAHEGIRQEIDSIQARIKQCQTNLKTSPSSPR